MSDVPPDLNQRVTHLESLLAHLQYDFERLSSVVVVQDAEIQRLRGELGKVEHRVVELTDRQEGISPADEKPPHY